MTLPLTAPDLAMMQVTQQAHMMDTCRLLTFGTGPVDEYGVTRPLYTEGGDLACGFYFGSGRRAEATGSQVPLSDAVLRLPLGTAIKQTDRVRLIARFGIALTIPENFEVVGQPMQGPSGLTVRINRVTTVEADNG